MGFNDRLPDMDGEALEFALHASAAISCVVHEEVWIDPGETEATKRAYAMGTNRWKQGDLGCERADFMDAIANAIGWGANECPACGKIRDS